ncbi:hypothetical protein HK104_005144, partial [Borealophlyctis nickersoniae]
DYVQGNFLPTTYQPDLSNYYTRYESDAINSTFASRDSVYSKFEANQLFKPLNWQPDLTGYYIKEEADQLFKPIDWVPDLSNYYTRYESDTITRDSVYSKFEANQLFKPLNWQPDLSQYALKTDLGDFYSKSEVDQRFDDIGFSFYTKDQADARYMPITYTPEEIDLSPYVLRTTADELYKSIMYEPDSNVWALKSDLVDFLPFPLAQQLYYERSVIDLNFPTKDFLSENHYTKGQSDNLLSNYWSKGELNPVQQTALGNYYTKTESDSLYLQPSALTNYYTKGESNALYVQASALTNYWNKGESDARYLLTGSSILAGGNVALQYNTLFLGNNGDVNHYISPGLSSLGSSTYNIDGVVVQGGIGGGVLGQSGTTVLRWLNNVVTIPGTLTVHGATNLNKVSVLPRNGNNTNPAFQVQAYGHDNVNVYFDSYYDSVAATLRLSHLSYFRFSKFNCNLFVYGGQGTTNNMAIMNPIVQFSPTGQVTFVSTAADSVTIQGGLNVGSAIYSNGNKVCTEAMATTIANNANPFPWQSKASIKLNSDATTDTTVYIDFFMRHHQTTACAYLEVRGSTAVLSLNN